MELLVVAVILGLWLLLRAVFLWAISGESDSPLNVPYEKDKDH